MRVVIRHQKVKSKTVVIVVAALVVLVSLVYFGRHYLFQMDWKFIASATSPDEVFTIKYYQSRSEAGHAPYGDNLVIESWKSFPNPKNGETFFAGYCGDDFSFKWDGSENIIIRCPNVTSQDPIRTQAIVVHGIKVEVEKE